MYPLSAAHSRIYQSGSAPLPPQPPFTNIAACWGLFNFNNDGYGEGQGVNISGTSIGGVINFTTDPPYPLRWANVPDVAGDPPYSLITWYDQNGNGNDLAGSFGARPILDATNKLISFDGATQGLAAAVRLYPHGTLAGTIYIDFAPQDLAQTGIVLETGTGATDQIERISIRMIAGVLMVSIYDRSIVPLPNTKAKVIGTLDRIWVAVTFDTSLPPSNQVQLYVNNLQTGVTAPASADLNGNVNVGDNPPSVGARNNATSTFLTANMWEIRAQTGVDDAAALLIQYNYWLYLKSLAP